MAGKKCEKHGLSPMDIANADGSYACPKCEVEKLLGILSHVIVLHDLGSTYEDDLDEYIDEIRDEYKYTRGDGSRL